MTLRLRAELKSVERDLLEMSATVEDMIADACRSLYQRRLDLLAGIAAAEESVNRSEVQIEVDCLRLLALHHPVCIDLRRVTTILKVTKSLERIADIAVNLSHRARATAAFPQIEIPAELQQMAEIAASMLKNALDSMILSSVQAARQVCQTDRKVDALNQELSQKLNNTIRATPATVEPAMHYFSAARNIHRIAEIATNIAEDVIFLVNGRIERHAQNALQQ